MKRLVPTLCFAIISSIFASHIAFGKESTHTRITVSTFAAGKVVSEIMLPIDTHGGIDFKGNHVDFDAEHATYHLTGNVQVTLKTKSKGTFSFIGDDIVVKLERLDADKAKAIADLDAMGISDQSIRKKDISGNYGQADKARQLVIDKKNMARLAEIINKFGWPGVRFAGVPGSQNAFLVLQHADSDSQRKYLPLMRDAVSKNDALGDELALLEDRVRVGDGLPQLYGSQVKPDGSSKELYPIEDEEHVDERRAAIGLQPLADYAKMFGIVYKPKPMQPTIP